MSSAKRVTGLLVLAKTEATYLAGASLAANADSLVTVLEHPEFQVGYVYDGQRGGAPGTGGNLIRGVAAGRTTTGTIRTQLQGKGAAYSISSFPTFHALIQACGMQAAFSAPSWSYAPVALNATPSSSAMAVYARGEVWPVSGAYGTFRLIGENPGPVLAEFDMQGVTALPIEVSAPSASFGGATTVIPPNNTSINMSFGAVTPIVRSWTYEHQLEIAPRVDLNNVNGHTGFTIGRRDPKLTVVIEHPALATYDFYTERQNATGRAVNLYVGSTANNIFRLQFPQAQLESAELTSDGPTATATLVFKPYVTTPTANDDVVFYAY